MLVPLMLSIDDLGEGNTSKTSEQFQPETTKLKPQLHTSKNHNSYNGIRTLPIATRVRPRDLLESEDHKYQVDCEEGKQKRKSHKRSKSTRTASQDDNDPLYEVTLYYPHNRACTIYRSREDFYLLRTGLHSRSSSAAPQSLASRPSDEKQDGQEEDPKEVARWDTLLRKALERFAKRGHGRHSIEWFLRRRLGDCEKVASGKRTGLPAGTMRRMKVKPSTDKIDTKKTDERPETPDRTAGDTGNTDEEIAATKEEGQHVTSEEEEEDNLANQSQTDNENVIKDESPKDEETPKNDDEGSTREGADKADDNTINSPKAAIPKGKQFTEVIFGLDSLPIEPFKPIPSDLGKLAGSSLAKRRKNKTKVEVTELADQNTANDTEDSPQDTNDAEDPPSDPELEDVGGTLTSSSSDDTILFTPTSSSIAGEVAGEDMSPGNPLHPNSAMMYMLMFSRRASSDSSDLGQEQKKFFSMEDLDDRGVERVDKMAGIMEI